MHTVPKINRVWREIQKSKHKCLTFSGGFLGEVELRYHTRVGDNGLYSFQWTGMKKILVMLYKWRLKLGRSWLFKEQREKKNLRV